MLRLRQWLIDALRVRPGQVQDGRSYQYGAQRPEMQQFGNYYAISPWVSIAVARMVEAAGVARLRVLDRRDSTLESVDHPLLGLLGPHGMTNDTQDSLEFLEEHLTSDYLYGNVYWYWWSEFGGAPTAVYQLRPEHMKIIPGRGRTIERYVYTHLGVEYPLSPVEITHFRRPNPYNIYYGLSPFVALYIDISGDTKMAHWNHQFFGDGVSIPAGIFVVPPETSEAEITRIQDEMSAKYGARRRTAVVRAAPGAAAWFDGGLKHHELDFLQGREQVRAMVFDAVGLPRGLMSEASTEAHARVAERQYYGNLQQRLQRVTARLNADAMMFWPGSQQWVCEYLDLRMRFADWQQEDFRQRALGAITTVNERRAVYNYPALPGQDEISTNIAQPGQAGSSFSDNGGGEDASSSGAA